MSRLNNDWEIKYLFEKIWKYIKLQQRELQMNKNKKKDFAKAKSFFLQFSKQTSQKSDKLYKGLL